MSKGVIWLTLALGAWAVVSAPVALVCWLIGRCV
jgi:hypothetical protein